MTVSISDNVRNILNDLFGTQINEHFYDIAGTNQFDCIPLTSVSVARRCFEDDRAMEFAGQLLAFKVKAELRELAKDGHEHAVIGWEFWDWDHSSEDHFATLSAWAIRPDLESAK